MIVISICGDKYSGKDTVADYLNKEYKFHKYALADPFKHALKHIFDLCEEQLWGKRKEEIDKDWNITPRTLMQRFSTELFQFKIYEIFPELLPVVPERLFWCKNIEKRIKTDHYFHIRTKESGATNIYYRYCISDLRYPHEEKFLRDVFKSIIIKVVRNTEKNQFSDHSSETEMEQIVSDYVLDNTGTLENLYKNIDKLMKKLNINKAGKYKLYVDGGGNIFNGKVRGKAVIYLYDPQREFRAKIEIEDSTNNEAEFKALIQGLKYLEEIDKPDSIIYSDSILVVNSVNGTYDLKAHNLIPLYNGVWDYFYKEQELVWIPREKQLAHK